MTSLFIDLLLGLLFLGILSKNTSAYATPLTSFGGSALFGLFHKPPGFFTALWIDRLGDLLVGAGFIIIRNTIHPEAKLLKILLILLIPNLIFYLAALLQSRSFMSPPYLSPSDKFITSYLEQLAGLIERTVPLLVGGLIVCRFN